MTAQTTLFDHNKIRAAIQASGLTVNETAFRAHLPFKTLQKIADGVTAPLDVRITTLARLADLLGLPLRSLFAEPEPGRLPDDETSTPPQTTADDATTVIAVLYDRGNTPTINSDLTNGLGWTLQRLHAAYDEAEKRLAPAGLALRRTHGEGSIIPIRDHTDTRNAVEHSQADSAGLKADVYQAVYQAMVGQAILPGRKADRRRFVVGQAANLGILDLRPRTPTLTDATQEAFV